VLVDVREGRFGDVPVATSHAIVGRLINFAEVCGGLGKAPLEDSHEVLEALVESRLLLHTSSASPQTASSPSAWIVRNVWVVRIVRMVAGIVRTEAEVALPSGGLGLEAHCGRAWRRGSSCRLQPIYGTDHVVRLCIILSILCARAISRSLRTICGGKTSWEQ
jgi:hypothetical protein